MSKFPFFLSGAVYCLLLFIVCSLFVVVEVSQSYFNYPQCELIYSLPSPPRAPARGCLLFVIVVVIVCLLTVMITILGMVTDTYTD